MKSLVGVLSLGILMGVAAWGQATAQIHGTVLQDASGSAVPGAEIKATQTETGISRTASSGADGGYVLTNLPLGPYQLEVAKEGFTKYVQSGIVLQVSSDPAIDPALKVGSVSEQVVVEANATQVETRNSGIGEVVQDATDRGPAAQRPQRDRPDHTGRLVCEFWKYSNSFLRQSAYDFDRGPGGEQGNLSGTEYTLDGANHVNYLAPVRPCRWRSRMPCRSSESSPAAKLPRMGRRRQSRW